MSLYHIFVRIWAKKQRRCVKSRDWYAFCANFVTLVTEYFHFRKFSRDKQLGMARFVLSMYDTILDTERRF